MYDTNRIARAAEPCAYHEAGRRTSGYFALKKLDGTVASNSISYKKLRLLEAATNYIIERK